MITLSLLKYLEDNNLGRIDEDLFFQKLTLNNRGIYITNISETGERGKQRRQRFELYSRGTDDVDGYKRLNDIVEFLNGSYGACELPAVPPVTDKGYKNVTITPMSTISSVGLDSNGRMIYAATGTIYF